MGVIGVEEATEADSAPVAHPFRSRCQEASYPIQRVSFAAPAPEGFADRLWGLSVIANRGSSAHFVESLNW